MSKSSVIQKEGWLQKKGHVNTNLKKRWIELNKNGILNYYEEVDSSLRQRGTVDLDKFSIEDDGPLGFKLITPMDKRGTFSFQCGSTDEKSDWIDALRIVQSTKQAPVEIKSGFLWKAGEINKAWKRRWCVLTPSEIKYYKKDTDAKPAGVVKLETYNSVSRVAPEEADKAFSFKIFNSEVPKQRVFYFSCTSEIEIENWFHAIKTCVEGVEIRVDVELFKNDPIQTVMCLYKPNLSVAEFLARVCSKTDPQVNPDHYQLLQGTSLLPCDPSASMNTFGPINFKVAARKGHAKRKAPPPGIKRIVQEALAEQNAQE